jgi:hypothetical protein
MPVIADKVGLLSPTTNWKAEMIPVGLIENLKIDLNYYVNSKKVN